MTDSDTGTWTKVESELVKWDEPGTVVEGEYTSNEVVDLEHGPEIMYTFRGCAGSVAHRQFFGTTQLNGRMSAVDVGQEVKVTYDGWNETATPTYKLFTVEVRLV